MTVVAEAKSFEIATFSITAAVQSVLRLVQLVCFGHDEKLQTTVMIDW